MTKIDESLILKLEKLARLKLNQEERTLIAGDLVRIIDMFDKLQEVDTELIAPTIHMSKALDRIREDVVDGELSQDRALANAPKAINGSIAVPSFLKLKEK